MLNTPYPPIKITFSTETSTKFARSKYFGMVLSIKQQTELGVCEESIAKNHQITLSTLKQIKRRAGIRKNAPLTKKRRTGMDAKIKKLLAEKMTIIEIAKKLETVPSYIERRMRAWEGKNAKPVFDMEFKLPADQ